MMIPPEVEERRSSSRSLVAEACAGDSPAAPALPMPIEATPAPRATVAPRIVRGAIVNELIVAARYGLEFAAIELRAAGVDPDEYGPLSFVGTLQPVTRTALAHVTGMRRTTLRDVLRRLIDRGHVQEDPNPHDGRSTLLVLTPAGQQIFDRGLPAFQRALAALDEALDGRLDDYEQAIWTVRVTLQQLALDRAIEGGA
jgi:DNA-binding MarR family transcriptional regulator